MGAEEVGHCGVGVEGEAEAWLGGDPFEEGEERGRWEREGVLGDEGGDVGWGERREESFEGDGERGLWGVLDCLGKSCEDGVLVLGERRWREPGGEEEG